MSCRSSSVKVTEIIDPLSAMSVVDPLSAMSVVDPLSAMAAETAGQSKLDKVMH